MLWCAHWCHLGAPKLEFFRVKLSQQHSALCWTPSLQQQHPCPIPAAAGCSVWGKTDPGKPPASHPAWAWAPRCLCFTLWVESHEPPPSSTSGLCQKEHSPESQLPLSAGSFFGTTEVALIVMASGARPRKMLLNWIYGREKMLQTLVWRFLSFFSKHFLLFRWLKSDSSENHKAGAALLKTLQCTSVVAGLLGNLKLWSLKA